ncbi:hypothetical protein Arub01_24860 [Actinomadura rubrobrunea]|uniref:Uncharacterized protein n=1 Tax=Actinomadura rubrobrunea TaxID=115335 RepID=A0A9W6PWV2_9ACTN|nr:hypothetical protein Arub01_24860 [Actinomadura rubrobrunea]
MTAAPSSAPAGALRRRPGTRAGPSGAIDASTPATPATPAITPIPIKPRRPIVRPADISRSA